MNRERKRTVWGMLFLLLLLLLLLFTKYFLVRQCVEYETTNQVLYNPYMGFAVNADYTSAVGENTLVYVDITWREWEPQEGEYAFDRVWEENSLQRWQEEGKKIVLRFVCDVPEEEEHMDIPDWLYEQTGDGVFYDVSYGKGYAPEYGNALFMEKHKDAVMALGNAFAESKMVVYVELGSLGHWGEWHMNYAQGTTRMPAGEVREKYVEAYQQAFPYACLLARRPFAETASRGLGLYNDMSGYKKDTEKWLDWIALGGAYSQPLLEEKLIPQPKVWNTAPIGGEFTSRLSWEEMLEENLPETLELLRQSHTTFLGPKVPVKETAEHYKEGTEEVLKTIGYRYRVSQMCLSFWKWQKEAQMTLTIENNGIAPLYFPRNLYVGIYDNTGRMVEKKRLAVDLREIGGESRREISAGSVPFAEGYTYTLWAENPENGEKDICLDMDVESRGREYRLYKVTAQNEKDSVFP